MSEKIEVIISYQEIGATGTYNELAGIIYKRLEAAGVPIIGGPTLPHVDFSKGVITTWDDFENNKHVVWEPNNI